MNGKTETNSKAPKYKVNDRVRISKYKNIFSKSYTEKWSRKTFNIDSILKTIPWTDKNGEKIIGSFYEKNCCGVNWTTPQNQTLML